MNNINDHMRGTFGYGGLAQRNKSKVKSFDMFLQTVRYVQY